MINITRLNDTEVIINCELIEYIEETPDTTITMTTGRKFIAKETANEIIKLVIEYKRAIYNQPQTK